jgi:hypothetical protein
MAEDQGVNGDIWNEEAGALLKLFNWESVGDSNIDIENVEGGKHGIDKMFQYRDSRRGTLKQGVFVEAKRYKTTSFTHAEFQKWLYALDKKIGNLRNAEDLHETYPDISNAILRNGLIVIWFSDIENYGAFRQKFCDSLQKLKTPASTKKESNKIFIWENDQILRLASVIDTIEKYEYKNKRELFLYYPSSERFKNAGERSKVLTLDYIMSRFIFAESVDKGVEYKIVFYFGPLKIEYFKTLKEALLQNDYLVQHKPLLLCLYERDENFRKIKPDVEKLFNGINFEMKDMNRFSDLPEFMKSK